MKSSVIIFFLQSVNRTTRFSSHRARYNTGRYEFAVRTRNSRRAHILHLRGLALERMNQRICRRPEKCLPVRRVRSSFCHGLRSRRAKFTRKIIIYHGERRTGWWCGDEMCVDSRSGSSTSSSPSPLPSHQPPPFNATVTPSAAALLRLLLFALSPS